VYSHNIDECTYLLLVDLERTLALAVRTITDADFLARILVERSQYSTTLPAIELDIFQLREHAATTRHDTRYTNKVVEMYTTQVTECCCGREICNADMNLGVDALVVWVADEDDLQGDLVKDGEHGARANDEEVCNDRHCVSEMGV
jgi:hypothetical protein